MRTRCGFCDDGWIQRGNHEQTCPYCDGTGWMAEGDAPDPHDRANDEALAEKYDRA